MTLVVYWKVYIQLTDRDCQLLFVAVAAEPAEF